MSSFATAQNGSLESDLEAESVARAIKANLRLGNDAVNSRRQQKAAPTTLTGISNGGSHDDDHNDDDDDDDDDGGEEEEEEVEKSLANGVASDKDVESSSPLRGTDAREKTKTCIDQSSQRLPSGEADASSTCPSASPPKTAESVTSSLLLRLSSQKADEGDENDDDGEVRYVVYQSELQMPDIMRLIQKDLSEPYSIYTYRYFIHNWPHLCFMARVKDECVGAIVCKLDFHKKVVKRGYIAMLAVDSRFRKRQIGSTLVRKAIEAMIAQEADEVVLETEITNKPALRLYENLGFVRDKRLFRYYLNGVDALRLKLWFR